MSKSTAERRAILDAFSAAPARTVPQGYGRPLSPEALGKAAGEWLRTTNPPRSSFPMHTPEKRS
jgi:hypothetical protein